MKPKTRKDETAIRQAHARGDHATAARETLTLYGDDIQGWLITTAGETRAREVCDELAKLLPQRLSTFEWKTSARRLADAVAREILERPLKQAHGGGDVRETVDRALRLYGREIFGLQMALANDENVAWEAFQTFGVDLMNGIASFGWHSSFRTWAYTVARHAFFRVLNGEARHANRGGMSISQLEAREREHLSRLMQQIRTSTVDWVKTEVKEEFVRWRQTLDLEDQELLILFIERRLTWKEIAEIRGKGEKPNTLAQRYKRFKDEKLSSFRTWAVQRGLVAP